MSLVITQKLVLRLLLLAVLLPVALSVVLGTGHLLRSMDDLVWGNVLLRVALLGGLAWRTQFRADVAGYVVALQRRMKAP